jgi:uncharacterized protein involved in cysteine biosynthesis
MESWFSPLTLALRELADPRLLKIFGLSLAISLLVFAAVAAVIGLELQDLAASAVWASWLPGGVGALTALLTSVWLFFPLAVIVAGFFQNAMCRAVEAAQYPDLPPARGAGVSGQTADQIFLALKLMIFGLFALMASLVWPGLGFLIGLALTAWALGRGFFVPVAMRRLSRRQALAAYDILRPRVLFLGAILALIGMVPGLNLLIPVLGPVAMLHLQMRVKNS